MLIWLTTPGCCAAQVGEVWVRGPTVFSGYFGVPAATAESFAEGEWFK
jgi:long-subunit acyl-CoA synthetase (AMP-forming)